MLILIFNSLFIEFGSNFDHLHLKTPAEIQKVAVDGLIQRLLNRNATYFKSIVDPDIRQSGKDTFKVYLYLLIYFNHRRRN